MIRKFYDYSGLGGGGDFKMASSDSEITKREITKLYFAKFLPSEDKELNVGDYVYFEALDYYSRIAEIIVSQRDIVLERMPADKKNGTLDSRQLTPGRLVLCSRDIKEGDKVYSKYNEIAGGGSYEVIVDKMKGPVFWAEFWAEGSKSYIPNLHINNWGKYVAEISPEATWVENGMEFDERDIKIVEFSKARRELVNEAITLEKAMSNWPLRDNLPEFMAYIKGPCKHFH